MRIDDIRSPAVVATHPNRSLAEAAQLMRERNVGALVVVDEEDPGRRPVAILTDRDIVLGQIGKAADLFCLTVDDVMSENLLSLPLGTDTAEAIEALCARGVRRATVIDRTGALAGIITLDDLYPALARELQELAKLIGGQSRRQPPRPGTPEST